MRFALLAALVVVVFAGCVKNAGKQAVTTCTTKAGEVLQVGDQGHAGDGCNTCVCQADFTLLCSTRACNDAGPAEGEGEGEGEGAGVDAGPVDEGPCHDEDGDGFYSCIDPNHPERSQLKDCDDTRWWVQPDPNAIEFPDTPEDDNCNGANDDFVTCDCSGLSTAQDLGAAMDLCGPQVVNATLVDGKPVQYGNVSAYSGVITPRLRTRIDDPNQPPIIIGNQCLATLSTGDATGNASLDPTTHGLAVSSCTTPAECPSGVSCGDDGACAFHDPDPDQADPNPVIRDLAQIRFSLKAPPNAAGFAFDFMFMSQEWPEFLCQQFNDTFYAIVDADSAVRDGHADNTAFDSAGRPITVNVGFFENPAAWTVDLTGTPYGASAGVCNQSFTSCATNADCGAGETCIQDTTCATPCTAADGCPGTCSEPAYCSDGTLEPKLGSGSGWLTTSVPVAPGQPFNLTLSVHDEGDQIYDSLVLLDNFRWLPQAPTLHTVKGGG